MPTQGAVRRQRRMVKFALFQHTQPRHQGARAQIAQRGERHHARHAQFARRRQRQLRALMGQPLPPGRPSQPPQHFHRRRKRETGRHRVQPDTAQQRIIIAPRQHPGAPAALSQAGAQTGSQRVTVTAAQRRRKMRHHLRVGIQGGKSRQIVITPVAQTHPWSAQR